MLPQAQTRTIYKYTYPVNDVITLELPGDGVLLKVGDQRGDGRELDFWAFVLPGPEYLDGILRQRVVRVYGTGGRISPGELQGFGHFDTVVTAGGALVWHVFLDFDGKRSIPDERHSR